MKFALRYEYFMSIHSSVYLLCWFPRVDMLVVVEEDDHVFLASRWMFRRPRHNVGTLKTSVSKRGKGGSVSLNAASLSSISLCLLLNMLLKHSSTCNVPPALSLQVSACLLHAKQIIFWKNLISFAFLFLCSCFMPCPSHP
jgi:hypothetical protein